MSKGTSNHEGGKPHDQGHPILPEIQAVQENHL